LVADNRILRNMGGMRKGFANMALFFYAVLGFSLFCNK